MRRASFTLAELHVRLYIVTTIFSMLDMSSEVISVGSLERPANVSVISGSAFHAEKALFLPLPENAEHVSQPETAWKSIRSFITHCTRHVTSNLMTRNELRISPDTTLIGLVVEKDVWQEQRHPCQQS